MKQIEIHIVERTSKKKFKNVEIYNLEEFQRATYGVLQLALNDIGFLRRLLPGFVNKLKVKVAIKFQQLFIIRLKKD